MSAEVPLASTPWVGWSRANATVPKSFEDVMSEELAQQLLDEEQASACRGASIPAEDNASTAIAAAAIAACAAADIATGEASDLVTGAAAAAVEPEQDTVNDLLLAQMLQLEFDREADAILKCEERKHNGTSKVTVSYAKYKSVHPAQEAELSDGESEICEAYEARPPPQPPQFSKRGISGSGAAMRSKHDAEVCSRRNVRKALDTFPLQIETGDAEGMDMRLSNRVYNQLLLHSSAEARRAARLHDRKEEQSTATRAFDARTRLALYKLVNSGLLESVHGVVAGGKESVIVHAAGGKRDDGVAVPAECAVKIYTTTLSEFRNREKYVRGDFFFGRDESKRQNSRRVMRLWAEKETLNLRRMRKFGVDCPDVVRLKGHILIMSFIGKDQVAAPKLKDAGLTGERLAHAYDQCIEAMHVLYDRCNMVHADLSEYNVLWHEERPWLIDVGQAVDRSHPEANAFLLRDCANVTTFFRKQGLQLEPGSEYELFNRITRLALTGTGQEFLQQIQDYEKEEVHLSLDQERKRYAFDRLFEHSLIRSEKGEPAAGAGEAWPASSDEDEDDPDDDDEEEEDAADGVDEDVGKGPNEDGSGAVHREGVEGDR